MYNNKTNIIGSVPLLWEQKGNDQKLTMYKS